MLLTGVGFSCTDNSLSIKFLNEQKEVFAFSSQKSKKHHHHQPNAPAFAF